MKAIKLTVAHSSLGGGSYKSPEVQVTEISNEGVLCGSSMDATLSVEKWEEDESFSW